MTKSRRNERRTPAAKTEKIDAPATPLTAALSQGHEAVKARVSAPECSGSTVTVGLKVPNGMVLRLQVQEEVRYPVMGGGTTIEKQWRPDPSQKSYTLHGSRTPHGEQPKCLVVGGYAMTPGIPADFMDKWLDQNKQLDVVTAGLIIVHKTTDGARGEATEKKDLRSGLEPMRPGNDPRIPKRAVRGKLVDAIETGDEQPAVAA